MTKCRNISLCLLLIVSLSSFAEAKSTAKAKTQLEAKNRNTYYGQCNQDRIMHEEYFWDLEGGCFVDIGAHNGITYSNSYFFEKDKQWKGICIEPIPECFNQLKQYRKCITVQGCVTDFTGQGQFLRITSPAFCTEMLSGLLHKYEPSHLNRIQRELAAYGGGYQIINVACYLLNDLLAQHQINHVHFLSMDTEGGEFDILQTVDFSKYQIDVILVEDNYKDPRFVPFLESQGFILDKVLDFDLLFVNKNFIPSRRIP